ncbi:MAG TPA: alpha/beta fold hydrolase [Candidatus Sulfotelmatobacter sp.]|nr:alpha/beta fold hydrolase [Candidatus Sulfotelmatobacter sp.]
MASSQIPGGAPIPDPGGASSDGGSSDAALVTAPGRWTGRAPFRARRWFRGGDVQTIASFLLPRKIHLPPAEERLVEVEPGIKVRCWCYWQGAQTAEKQDRANAMTLIVVHGLEGSSDSKYMQGVARDGLAAGMNVVLMNQRNCGGMDHFAPTLYNSSLSGDVAAVVRNVIENDGVSRFALIGFSMGGNLVLKLAGEWGRDGNAPAQFRAVAAVCPAIDLAASADALHEPRNRIYEYYFLMQLFRRLRLKARLFPGKFDVSRLRGVSSLRMFDDRITAHYCGFAGADDYYARAAAANVVDRIAVPTLIIHSANDPFIRLTPETLRRIATNPNITYVETEDGGHCAFLGQRNPGERNPGERNGDAADDGRWAEHEVVEFVAGQ